MWEQSWGNREMETGNGLIYFTAGPVGPLFVLSVTWGQKDFFSFGGRGGLEAP